jgi:hypothetical protein
MMALMIQPLQMATDVRVATSGERLNESVTRTCFAQCTWGRTDEWRGIAEVLKQRGKIASVQAGYAGQR